MLLLGWVRPRIEPVPWFICKRRREILRVVVDGTHADTHVVARWNVLTADSGTAWASFAPECRTAC